MSEHHVRIDDTSAICDCGQWFSLVKEPGGQEEQLVEDGARHLEIHGWDNEVVRNGMIGPVVALIATTRRR